MSGGQNKKFIKQKEKYLDNHFIVIDAGNFTTGLAKGIYDFDLKEDKNNSMQSSTGKRIKVVTLRAMDKRGSSVGKRTNIIHAYYLPYAKNTGFSHRLVEDVDFCFTDTMNGCTFGVGSGANPLISHYNFVNEETQLIDQARIDRHINRRYIHGVSKLTKADYKHGGGMDQRVTMIGIRSNKVWSFYYQRHSIDLVQNVKGKSQLKKICLNQSFKFT